MLKDGVIRGTTLIEAQRLPFAAATPFVTKRL